MKKWIVLMSGVILAAVVAVVGFLFLGIEKNPGDEPDEVGADLLAITEANTGDKENKEEKNRKKDEKEAKDEKKHGKRTLMIYMIGSDLESRSGAGTDDLEEIKNSGIDLEKVNVVVLAGGAPRWHNDLATRGKNTILHLEKDGFKTIRETESISMGTAGCLSDFLNFAYKNYPADRFALIMWNHGNGPVVGYGKDMLFDSDSLTLEEMSLALSDSPFNSGNKLSWVGFDACLMSSAELACVWSPHADYLVASQEIEPSFGWNYSVMKNFSQKGTEVFLSELVDGYMSDCMAYYEKKGYENRDTTLSCIKLSYVTELKNVINSLFAKAGSEIDSKYDVLVRNRVATRALGRASTGSEYDLIDLKDMAKKLEDVYPEEANQLKNILEKMIIKNGTNTENLCGMSIYYPFYNKYYYEKSWGDVYKKLGSFPTYGEYLEKYQDVWLSDGDLDKYTAPLIPERVNGEVSRSAPVAGTYKLTLSPEQNQTYADAKFYVLENKKGSLYHPIMSSENVVNKDGVLYIDFSGMAIFAADSYGKRYLPVSIEHDSVGNTNRYSVLAQGRKLQTGLYSLLDFRLVLDNITHDVSTSALLPYKTEKEEILGGGKLEEENFENWDIYNFYRSEYMYLTRYDNGMVRPLGEWLRQTYFESSSFLRKDGFGFICSPIDSGKFFVVFEITDTQGNKYCSEILPITSDGSVTMQSGNADVVSPEPIHIVWNEGDKVKILEKEKVTVFAKIGVDYFSGKTSCVFEIENNNDFVVSVSLDDVVFNGDIYDGYCFAESIPPNSAVVSESGVFPDSALISIGEITDLRRIEGNITIKNVTAALTLLANQHIEIDIEEKVLGYLPDYYEKTDEIEPYLGALAEKQVLVDDGEFRIILLHFGRHNKYSDVCGYLCVENLSDEPRKVDLVACSASGITDLVPFAGGVVPAHKKTYKSISLGNDLAKSIKEIESLDFLFTVTPVNDAFAAPEKQYNVPVNLKEKGISDVAETGENVIFEENGVRIILDSFKEEQEDAKWYVTIVNETDKDISLHLTTPDDSVDNLGFYLEGEKVCARSRRSGCITYYQSSYEETSVGQRIDFKVHILDFFESEVIFSPKTVSSIYVIEPDNGGKLNINHISPRTEIFSGDGVGVYLKSVPCYEGHTYTIEVKNDSDADVNVKFDDIIINENIQCEYSASLSSVDPGSTATNDILLTDEIALGIVRDITSVSGVLTVKNTATGRELCKPIDVDVSISGDGKLPSVTPYFGYITDTEPYLDALAREQLLWENDILRVKLIQFAAMEGTSCSYLSVENLTDKIICFKCDAVQVNGKSFFQNTYENVLSNAKRIVDLRHFDFDDKISSIEDMVLHLAVWKGKYALSSPFASIWKDIELVQRGTEVCADENRNVIFEGGGVRIILDGYDKGDGFGFPQWNMTVINDNDYDITVKVKDNFTDSIFGFDYSNINVSAPCVRAHGSGHIYISNTSEEKGDTATFGLEVCDPYEYEKVYYSGNEWITLYAEK